MNINNEDIKNAELLFEDELLDEINLDTFFKASIYCILAQAERYDKQLKIYRKLLIYDCCSPTTILEKPELLNTIVKNSHFPNLRITRINNFTKWYKESKIPHDIIRDANNGKKKGVEFRNLLAENAPSIGYKSSSLILIKCGYTDVIPIDIWMLRYLRDRGFDVEAPDYMTVGGMTKKAYLHLEDILKNIAMKEYHMPPALFQGAIWGKYSTYNYRKEKKLKEFI